MVDTVKSIDPRFALAIDTDAQIVRPALVLTTPYGPVTFRAIDFDDWRLIDVGDGSGPIRFEPFPFLLGQLGAQGDLQVDETTLQFPNATIALQFPGYAVQTSVGELALNGVLDHASISLYLVNLRSMANFQHSVWEVVGLTGIDRSNVTLQLQSRFGRAVRPGPRTLIQEGCNNQLFSAECGLVRASYAVVDAATGTLAGYERVYLESGLTAYADDYWALGQIQFTSGKNAGAARTVGWSRASAGALKWVVPLLYEVVAGDAFEIVPGCDKTWTKCAAFGPSGSTVDNSPHFRGMPNVPPPEVMLP